MSWPAAVMWILIAAAAFARGSALLYLLLISGIFGSLQMMPGDAANTVLPQSLCALVMTAKILVQRGNIVRLLHSALDMRRMGLFTLFLVYSVLSAPWLPRLFQGQTAVVPIAGFLNGTSPLEPSNGTYTQSGYLVASYATALTFSVLGSRPDFRRIYLNALLVASIGVVLSGLADMACYYAGLTGLLEPFRTASYGLLIDNEVIGAKRVTGLTPEASAFGALCMGVLGALTFLRPLYTPMLRRWVVPLVIASLIVMIVLSTSSGAYVSLAVFVLVYGFNAVMRLRARIGPALNELSAEIVIVGFGLLVLFAIVLFVPEVLDSLFKTVDLMVFQKSSSSSYIERNMWTQAGIDCIPDTGGLGVGLGSIRTSNWFVSILASTGVFGAVLLALYLVHLFVRDPGYSSPENAEFYRGLRCALLPVLCMAALGGTIPDIGVMTASMFGLLSSDAPRLMMAPVRARSAAAA